MTEPNFRTNRTQAASSDDRRPNAYGARCVDCGTWVEARQGYLTKKSDGSWGVECREHLQRDESPRQGSIFTQVHPTSSEFVPNWITNDKMIFDGIYTFEAETGHRTYKLATQSNDDDFKPGAQIISVLTGPDNTHDYTSIGHIQNSKVFIWKRFQDTDTEQHWRQFLIALGGESSKIHKALNCFRCHRLLTTPESIALGMGPECSSKGI